MFINRPILTQKKLFFAEDLVFKNKRPLAGPGVIELQVLCHQFIVCSITIYKHNLHFITNRNSVIQIFIIENSLNGVICDCYVILFTVILSYYCTHYRNFFRFGNFLATTKQGALTLKSKSTTATKDRRF